MGEDLPKRPPRVAYVSLGCRVNRVETDVIARELERAGCVLARESNADVIVINTCAVTGEAEAKARKAVRHAAGLAQKPVIVATGCVANLFADELRELGENVVVEADKALVATRALAELGFQGAPDGGATSQTVLRGPYLSKDPADLRKQGRQRTVFPEDLEYADGSQPLKTLAEQRAHGHESVTPTGRTRPGIKVQDGCDLRCSYCIVWKARGASRSVDPNEVVRQVRDACEHGAREVMLTGINLGRYRARCGGMRLRLPELLELVLERTDVGRVRLGSIEPQDVDERLAEVIAGSDSRVAPFLHMCLQSGCDETLARMGRVYDTALFAERMAVVRERVPACSFGTDVIVGFPGESDEEFERSLAFCREARFSRMHVFRFSPRPGTPAAVMGRQVAPKVSAVRAERMRALAEDLRLAEARALVGERDLVVVQAPGRGVSAGLFDAELDASIPVGELVPVRVTDVRPDATLTCEVIQ